MSKSIIKKRLVKRQASLLLNCHHSSSCRVEEHLSQEMPRNACAFHTFFLGVSQVPEPRKVRCHTWSVGHSSWLCTAFFYSTVFNGSNRTTFNSGLEHTDLIFLCSNRTKFYSGLEHNNEVINDLNYSLLLSMCL